MVRKIIQLYKLGENRANLAEIYETLFSHVEVQSMNKALVRLKDSFNKAAEASGVHAACLITERKKGGSNGRWIWFEGVSQELPEAMKGDLESVAALQTQTAIDINVRPLIVIVNYNQNEFAAAQEVFDCKEHELRSETKDGLTAFNLGICGSFEVKLVYYSEQGYAAGVSSATEIYHAFHPYAILSVGIGYASEDEIGIGDVLVPKYITDANKKRFISDGTVMPNGLFQYATSHVLYEKLFAIDKMKTSNCVPEWPRIHNWGGIISEGSHINSKLERDKRKQDFDRSAMGGDMELAGIGYAAHKLGSAFHWLAVKGVSDTGDGNVNTAHKEQDQAMASRNAAIVVRALIEGLPAPDIFPTSAAQGELRKARMQRTTEFDHWRDEFQSQHASEISLGYVQSGFSESEVPQVSGRTGVSLQDSLMEWVENHEGAPLFALLGEYGMGKTVNCQKFSDIMYQKSLENPAARSALYFDLRNVTNLKNGVPTLDGVMLECAERGWISNNEDGSKVTLEVIYERIRAGDVIIFDGLDEVLVKLDRQDGGTFTRTLLSAIDMAKRGGVTSPKVLISTRTQYFRTIEDQNAMLTGYERGNKRADAYVAMLILPYRDEQIRSYLSVMLGETDVEPVMHALHTVYDLKSLAERPYTLWLISELFPTIQKWALEDASISTAKLYDEITQRWLMRDDEKHFLIKEHKRELSAHLAAHLWRSKAATIPVLSLEEWCLDWLASRPKMNLRYNIAGDNCDRLLEDLRNTTYLVRSMNESEDGMFRFSHTSLQEYFLAEYLITALKNDDCANWDMPEPNQETFAFLGQMLAEEKDSAKLLATMTRWAQGEMITVNLNLLHYKMFAKDRSYPMPTLQGANFTGATFSEMKVDCDLPQARFAHAVLRDAEFSGADLRSADFTGADLFRAKFFTCDLSGADFADAKLHGAKLRQSQAGFRGTPETHRTQWMWCENLSDFLEQDKNSFVTEFADRYASDPGVRRLRSFGCGDSFLNAIAWSPDGKMLAAGGNSTMIQLWDVRSGECVAMLEGEDAVQTVAWSPDGKLLASGGSSGAIRLWHADTGECCGVLEGHVAKVQTVAWSPDGKTLASGGGDGAIRLWDIQNGGCSTMLEEDLVQIVVWSPDGKLLASCGKKNNIQVWDTTRKMCCAIFEVHGSSVMTVAWSPDGKTLASGGTGEAIKLWGVDTGTCRTIPVKKKDWIMSIVWSSDGKKIASGALKGGIQFWDIDTGECYVAGVYGNITRTATWSPDGKTLAVEGYGSRICLLDIDERKYCMVFEKKGRRVGAIAWSPDGRTIASIGGASEIQLWNAKTGKCGITFEIERVSAQKIAWSPNGKILASGDFEDNIRLWDSDNGQCHLMLDKESGGTRVVAWSPNGKTLASEGNDRKVQLWNVESGECGTTLDGCDGNVARAAAWSPDGKTLATGGFDGVVRLWNVESGACDTILEGEGWAITTIVWSPDGKLLACGRAGREIVLWDVKNRRLRLTRKGHSSQTEALAWSPDGKTLASCGDDVTVRLWDVKTGACHTILEGYNEKVNTIAWSPDGEILASGDEGGIIRFWNIRTGEFWYIETFLSGEYAVWNTDQSLRFASNMAWKSLGWETVVDGKIERLPAELFGRLPEAEM